MSRMKGFVKDGNDIRSVTVIPCGGIDDDRWVVTQYDSKEDVYKLSMSHPRKPQYMLPVAESTDFKSAKEGHKDIAYAVAFTESFIASYTDRTLNKIIEKTLS